MPFTNLGNTWTDFGRTLGSGVGEGISRTIQSDLDLLQQKKLAKMLAKQGIKQQDLQKEYDKKQLSSLLGTQYAPETLDFLASMPQQQRYAVMSTPGALEQLQQMAGLGQLGGGMQQLMQQPQIQQTQMQQQQPQMSAMDMLSMINGGQPQSPMGMGIQQPMMQQQQPMMQQMQPQQQMPQQMQGGINPLQMALGGAKPMTPYQQQMLGIKGRGVQTQESEQARKFIDPIHESAQKAKNDQKDYKALIKLADSGKLRAGTSHALLSKLGLQDFYRNIETEAADKITNRLKQNVAGVFGTNSRVTNFLEQIFQKSLPSLWNTPQGIKLISKINLLAGEGALLKDKAVQDIMRQTGGQIPYDIAYQIDEKIAPRLQQIEDETINLIQTGGRSTQTFDNLPDPSQFKGKKIRDTETGKMLKSSGSQWLPAE